MRDKKLNNTKPGERAILYGLEIIFKIVGVVSIVSNVSKVRSVKYIKANFRKRKNRNKLRVSKKKFSVFHYYGCQNQLLAISVALPGL